MIASNKNAPPSAGAHPGTREVPILALESLMTSAAPAAPLIEKHTIGYVPPPKTAMERSRTCLPCGSAATSRRCPTPLYAWLASRDSAYRRRQRGTELATGH